jgi:hypothetical protein
MERMKLREMCQHAHLTDGISSIQNLRRRAAWQMIPEAHAWTRQLPERLNPSHKSKRPAAGGRSRTWRLIMLRPYLSCTSTTSTTSHDLYDLHIPLGHDLRYRKGGTEGLWLVWRAGLPPPIPRPSTPLPIWASEAVTASINHSRFYSSGNVKAVVEAHVPIVVFDRSEGPVQEI